MGKYTFGYYLKDRFSDLSAEGTDMAGLSEGGEMMMNLVDMHCDTISRLMQCPAQESLVNNKLCIRLDKMEKVGTLVQFFACFVHAVSYETDKGNAWNQGMKDRAITAAAWDRAWQAVLDMAARIDQEQNEKINVACSYEDILKNQEQGRITAIKTVEEGGVLNGSLSRLGTLYEAGIRLMTLTWNYENCLGYPNSRDSSVMEQGLTAFGAQTVERMNELGMLVDVSHLSDGGFWDCIQISRQPICASHSNARALCSHPRNLTDEMLKALGENGGVAGLNFYPAFLCENGNAAVDDIARHALHMIQVGGEDVVAIGTDFDGFDNEPRESWVNDVSDMELVWEAMYRRGITPRQIDKIKSQNALRVIKAVMK
ncbi:dipeptidase [Faecalicatena sp.]|nr:dipeptidase [Lachnospiraceae bacterium]